MVAVRPLLVALKDAAKRHGWSWPLACERFAPLVARQGDFPMPVVRVDSCPACPAEWELLACPLELRPAG